MRRAGSIYSSADSLGNIKTGNLSAQFCSFFCCLLAFTPLPFFPSCYFEDVARTGTEKARARDKSLNWTELIPGCRKNWRLGWS
ncbi:hypothetical protein GGI42DRAFT_13032 [Trichoderma sp. SZMC 28013]